MLSLPITRGGQAVAHTGQAIANPASGERVVFRATAADTRGQLLSMDYHAPRTT